MANELQPGRVRLVVTTSRDLKSVRDSLSWLPLPPHLVSDVVLAASELVTNALQYAPGPCEFTACYPTASGSVRVEVSDSLAVALPLPVGQVRADALRGRGLHIIEALVSRWGVDTTGADGKTVWFEVDASE